MLANLAGNMGEDIALAGKIDTKHRARQHLRHRPFRHDLFFLRHCAKHNRRRCLSQPACGGTLLLECADMSLRAVTSHSDVATNTCRSDQNRSSEMVGKYSPSSCR